MMHMYFRNDTDYIHITGKIEQKYIQVTFAKLFD